MVRRTRCGSASNLHLGFQGGRQLESVFFFHDTNFSSSSLGKSAIHLHLATRNSECGLNLFYVLCFFFAVALQTQCLLSSLCFARCGYVCLVFCICFRIFTFHIVCRCSLQVEKQCLEGNPTLPSSCIFGKFHFSSHLFLWWDSGTD